VNVADSMSPGQQYTFSLQPSGIVAAVYRPSTTDLLTTMQDNPILGNVSVAISKASFFSFGNDILLVTFIYRGDGSDQVSDVFQSMLDDFSASSLSDLESLSFIAAIPGPKGIGTEETPGLPKLPDTSSLWAIALIGLLAVFLLSGGASVVRRVAA